MVPKNKLEILRRKAREDCECKGTGCGKCASKIDRMSRYALSGIPVKYWGLAFRDFAGDKNFGNFVINVLSDIDQFYLEGKSLAFVGNLGTGKTYAACSILKKAIVSGYSGKYLQMADIVNSILSKKLDSKSYLDSILDADFLVIDELDSRFFPSDAQKELFSGIYENVFRHRAHNLQPTIICTNETVNILDVFYGASKTSINSLNSQYLKIYPFPGIDFRRKINE